MSTERRKELIKSIKPNKANFDFITNSSGQKINGSLMLDIEAIMEIYTSEQLHECKRQKIELQKKLSEYETHAIQPSFKGA